MIRCISALVAFACGPGATAFRTTDLADGRDVRLADQPIAHVRVWSNGGYVAATGAPTTHIGFEITNTSTRPIVFETDALQLALFDNRGAELASPAFAALSPLAPAVLP